MSNSQTDATMKEASLFNDKFANADNEEDSDEQTYPPENNKSQQYKDAVINSEVELLDVQTEAIIDQLTKRELNEEYIHAGKSHSELDEKQVNEFDVDIEYNILSQITNSHKSCVEETFLSVTENGLMVIGVDSSNVIMMQSWIDSKDIENLSVSKNGIIGLKWNNVKEIMSDMAKGGEVNVKTQTNNLLSEDGDGMVILTDSDDNEFTISLTNPNKIRQPADMPEIDYTSHARLPLRELQQVVERCKEYSDHILVKAEDSSIAFYSEGDVSEITKSYSNTDDLTTDLSDIQEVQVQTNEGDESLFSLDLLDDYFTRLRKSQTKEPVIIHFADEMPMKCKTKITDNSYNMLFIAPRIQAN